MMVVQPVGGSLSHWPAAGAAPEPLPPCLSLVYVDFIFYNLLVFFSSSSDSVVESLGLSIYEIMSSANRDNLIPAFVTCSPFISIYCLEILARAIRVMLNRGDFKVNILG